MEFNEALRYPNQSIMEEQAISASLIVEKIDRKVEKWIKKYRDDIDDQDIEIEVFQESITYILGAYS